MRRWHRNNDGIFSRVAKVAGAALFAGAGVILLTQIDSLRRYIRLRRIANGHPTPPGTLKPGADAPPRWGTAHWPMH
ncbi:MAG TPA: hypothetical protein VN947_29715 [Polyangia bacterium]|nr:hypothetical protein [Polyangia bacterium]